MKNMLKGFVCFLVLCLAVPAFAASTKEYAADMVDVKSGRVTQKLAVMPDRIYSEGLDAQGRRAGIAIIRMDQSKMYVVIGATKSYMELPFNKDWISATDFNIGMAQTKREKVGTETVSGYKADKYRITATVMGRAIVYYEWLTPEFDRMPIRTETEGVIQEMRNITPGRQDAALFEVPNGYTRDTQMEQMMKVMMGEK